MKIQIGNRIRSRRRQLGVTQAKLASKMHIGGSSVSQWENGETSPRGENLYRLAELLEVGAEWILKGDPSGAPNIISKELRTAGKVPLLSEAQAANWLGSMEGNEVSLASNWISTTAEIGDKSFAFKVVGNSMVSPSDARSIPEGAVIIVDPDRRADNGSIVVVKINKKDITVKKLIVDAGSRYLSPLNPDYKPIVMTETMQIIGVAVRAEIDL